VQVGGAGKIVVVGTPIGNLGDMSPRASEALTSADVVACEDTRRTGRLFQLLGLTAPRLVRLDDHAEAAEAPRLVARAAAGATVAVVSDAGLPGLSDPGGRTVALAVAEGVTVEVVPGPFAGAVAAVVSGLLDGSGLLASLALAPFVPLGYWGGLRLVKVLSEAIFHRLLVASLLLIGIKLLVDAIVG
jgi:16S rRNA (cytidine1402-2'-O)-methyltransferase